MPETKSKLVEYLDEVYDHFATNRQPLEENWLLSYDAFRGQYSHASEEKWKKLEGTGWRSKVFIKVTRMKVVAAVAQLYDILFQGGAILPFAIQPTPIPQNVSGVMLDSHEAKARAGNMQLRIEDTLKEDAFDRTEMTAILECAIYGMSALKSPVIRYHNKITYDYKVPLFGDSAGMFLPDWITQKYGRFVPGVQRMPHVSVENPTIWDLFWDPEASSPKDGFMLIHRQHVSAYALRSMANDRKMWDMEAVNRVITGRASASREAGTASDSTTLRPGLRDVQGRKRDIVIREHWGLVPKQLLDETEAQRGDIFDGNETEIFCITADDELVLPPIINPLPGYLKPFHFASWEDIPHEPHGVGIPENMRDAQMMMNSSIRCFIDNKALSGNVLMAIQERHLEPGQSLDIYPGAKLRLAPSAMRASDAVQWHSPPDVGRGLLDLYRLFGEVADEESAMPKLQQGLSSKQDPDTAYGISKLLENSNRIIGSVIRRIDEGHIESVVKSLYHFYMHTDEDESVKGDYTVQATGYSSYQDRISRGQSLIEFLSMMLSSPVLARLVKPVPFAREIAKIKDLEADDFIKTDDELKKESLQLAALAAQNSQGAVPPPDMGGEPVPPEPLQ